jgi:hypothetical protein
MTFIPRPLINRAGRMSSTNAPLLPSQIVNVLQFGASTSNADNQPAFAEALATGRPVFIPAGEYKIANPIVLPAGTTGSIGTIETAATVSEPGP